MPYKDPAVNKQCQDSWHKRHHREVRERVLAKYGGKCSCPGCDISQYEFLGMDHVNGGGNKERRERFPCGQQFYSWLDKHDRTDDYAVLCHNCNLAKGFYGRCPRLGETMPEGTIRDTTSHRHGSPVPATDPSFDSNPVPAENPSLNSNPVPAADPTFDSNPVTWAKDPAHFGNPVTLP